jgi:hypothetical protein
MLTSWAVRADGLTDGQVVTLVVGLGIELLRCHEAERPYGPIHPTHVRLDAARRPRLVDVPETPGWTTRDDWAALLRLGRVVAAGPWGTALSLETAGGREGRGLLRWVAAGPPAQPLPAWAFPELETLRAS